MACAPACVASCRCRARPSGSAPTGVRRARPRRPTARRSEDLVAGRRRRVRRWPMKRFYKDTATDAGDGGFRVLLDGKPMRTPAKAVLVVPAEPLAAAIAGEWRAVPDKAEINVSHLPLTRLATTGLDRVTVQRQRVIADTAKYAGSDMLCYRATGPASLVTLQSESWQPLLDWAAERYDARLLVVTGTTFVAQPAAAIATLCEAVAAHGDL